VHFETIAYSRKVSQFKKTNVQGVPIKNNPLGKIRYLNYCKRIFHQIYKFHRGGFRLHMHQISLQYLLCFTNCNNLNLKVHFSEWICQWIIMCAMLYWNTIEDTCQSWPTSCRTESPFCCQYRMICFMQSLIKQLYHFATDFNRALLQQVGTDIVNTLSKKRE